MTSRIGFNIHAQGGIDPGKLLTHLKKIQPASVVVMDGLGLAKEIKAALPNTIVIHRNYGLTKGDEDVHLRFTPRQWLELRAGESEGGIFLYTTNEPGFDTRAIDWHIELLQLAGPMNVKLVIGNWAVGNPGAGDWGRAKELLKLLDRYRDRFILGLHEYWCGIVTSGLFGGWPDNAGVQPGTPGGQNLIPKDQWPADVSKVTMFHCGRFKFLVNYCQQNGIKPPRIILTEHGADDVSDIKGWAEKLEKTAPYTSIRGWKSLQNQWNQWFGKTPGWAAERAYFEQLAWADRVIYQNSPVEGQCVFSWGHSSNDWYQFDISTATEFQKLLEAHAAQVVEPKPTLPVGKPANYTQRISAKALNAADIHIGPDASYPRLTKFTAPEIQPGNRVRLFKPEGAPMPTWVYVHVVVGSVATQEGWVYAPDFQWSESATTQEIPKPAPIPVFKPYSFGVTVTVYATDQEAAERMMQLCGTVVRHSPALLAAVAEAAARIANVKEIEFDMGLPQKVEGSP